jgi:hypothetical protein
MNEELERIVVAKSDNSKVGTSIVIFDGTSYHFTESYSRDMEGVAFQYCGNDTERQRFLKQVQNGPKDNDPHYWQIFAPLKNEEFELLKDTVNNYKY